jgi:hypothetical protein
MVVTPRLIPDVDCDCICDHLNLSMPAPAVYGFFESVAPSQVFLSPLKYFDPTALPPRHGSYVLIRAPLLGVRTASDLCCRDLLTEVSRFLVHTLCYYYILFVPVRGGSESKVNTLCIIVLRPNSPPSTVRHGEWQYIRSPCSSQCSYSHMAVRMFG